MKTTNDTGEERSVDSLYFVPEDNGCGHIVFKLQTKQPISVPSVTLIPITDDTTNLVNQMGKDEGEQEGIVCTDMFGKAMLNSLDYSNYNANDYDSNVSDNSYYVFNHEEFNMEQDDENKLDNEHGIGDEEVHANYFVNHDDESDLDEDNNENHEP